VLFDRADLNRESLGDMMNRLARRQDGVIVSEQTLADGGYEIRDKIRVRIYVDVVVWEADFTIVGTFRYFPTVYEARDGKRAIIGNLEYLYQQIGATLLHHVWLRIDPASDLPTMRVALKTMGVCVNEWLDARDENRPRDGPSRASRHFRRTDIRFPGRGGTLGYRVPGVQPCVAPRAPVSLYRAACGGVLAASADRPAQRRIPGIDDLQRGRRWWESAPWPHACSFVFSRLPMPRCSIPTAATSDRLGSSGWISAAFCRDPPGCTDGRGMSAVSKGVFQALRMGDRE